MPKRILIMGNDLAYEFGLDEQVRHLRPQSDIDVAETPSEAMDLVRTVPYECMFIDDDIADFCPEAFLEQFLGEVHEIDNRKKFLPPIVVVAQHYNARHFSKIIRAGATDYILKRAVRHDTLELMLTKAREVFHIKQDQKLSDDRLFHASKMEAIGSMAGGIAHDSNNILTIIMGNIKLLRRNLNKTGLDQPEIIKHAEAIEKAAKRGADLIKRLMIFSRHKKLDMQAVDLNSLIIDMEGMLGRVLNSDIVFIADLTEDLWPVKADETQLESALVNMVMNAGDAMPDGGRLTIETQNLSLGKKWSDTQVDVDPGDYAVLSITDTGIGIEKSVVKNIFDPFYTTKEVGEGTGLGLSMVYGLIKDCGGTISVYSEPGNGTSFRIFLPRYYPEKDRSEDGSKETKHYASGETGGSEKILVVEDEEEIRAIGVSALAEAGYNILEAANSDEALSILQNHIEDPPDLLFTDVSMPGDMNGIQLAARVSALKKDIKILFTTGYALKSVPDANLIDYGELISKPYDQDVLLKRVREILDSREVPLHE